MSLEALIETTLDVQTTKLAIHRLQGVVTSRSAQIVERVVRQHGPFEAILIRQDEELVLEIKERAQSEWIDGAIRPETWYGRSVDTNVFVEEQNLGRRISATADMPRGREKSSSKC